VRSVALPGQRILFAEDQTSLLITSFLKDAGTDVAVFDNGKQGFELCEFCWKVSITIDFRVVTLMSLLASTYPYAVTL
jgi:hypothetical protein